MGLSIILALSSVELQSSSEDDAPHHQGLGLGMAVMHGPSITSDTIWSRTLCLGAQLGPLVVMILSCHAQSPPVGNDTVQMTPRKGPIGGAMPLSCVLATDTLTRAAEIGLRCRNNLPEEQIEPDSKS